MKLFSVTLHIHPNHNERALWSNRYWIQVYTVPQIGISNSSQANSSLNSSIDQAEYPFFLSIRTLVINILQRFRQERNASSAGHTSILNGTSGVSRLLRFETRSCSRVPRSFRCCSNYRNVHRIPPRVLRVPLKWNMINKGATVL